ncbi:hypothetical protein CC78DRAFT_572724 [Lojkania enalia]|uniref:Uncharacterized protein n=1 Tax=Lojkania enalia TaxID=147567 RepID=A0A9P4JWY8_9PLEO|nr:hypothetical protein CC78DRAFT_572724 [Didymosphaeria enalia]
MLPSLSEYKIQPPASLLSPEKPKVTNPTTHIKAPRKLPETMPFAPSPSRLVLLSYPTPKPIKPLTTLLLSLPLANKIHALLLISREIKLLAEKLFGGEISEQDVARQMSRLEERYEGVREEVEDELEAVWVNAGFLSPSPPTFPSSAGNIMFQKPEYNASPSSALLDSPPTSLDMKNGDDGMKFGGYTVDKDLKRKRPSQQKERGTGKMRKVSEEVVGNNIQPIGITQAMISLRGKEAWRLRNWDWKKACREDGAYRTRWGGSHTDVLDSVYEK